MTLIRPCSFASAQTSSFDIEGWNPRCIMRASTAGSSHVRRKTAAQQCCSMSGEACKRSSPQSTLDTCLSLVRKRKLADLVDYLPSEIVHSAASLLEDRTVGHREGKTVGPNLHHVLEAMLLRRPSEHLFDSYALRHLVLASPVELQVLSSLQVGSSRFVQRCAVIGETGEEAVLTFTLSSTPAAQLDPAPPAAMPQGDDGGQGIGCVLGDVNSAAYTHGSSIDSTAVDCTPVGEHDSGVQDQIAAGRDYSDAAGAAGSSSHAQLVWRLCRVQGEPRHGAVITAASPEFGPEAVVQAQLAALRVGDLRTAYALLSPATCVQVGPFERYVGTMLKHPTYRHLVAHGTSRSVRRCQSSSTTYLELVVVRRAASAGPHLFLWVLSLEGDTWVITAVSLVEDPRVLDALRLDQQEDMA